MKRLLIATRIKGSDRWNILNIEGVIVDEGKSLTDTLERYHQHHSNGYRGEFIINPADSTIHIPIEDGSETPLKRKYSIYGDEE